MGRRRLSSIFTDSAKSVEAQLIRIQLEYGTWSTHLSGSIDRHRRILHSVLEIAHGCYLLSMERWWGDLQLINGTFKGGGVKGIAYAGALSALRKRDMWFGSVAGTSAGAITASLIAAGYEPEEMISLIDELLLSIKRRLGLLWAGVGDAVFDGKKLRGRLEQLFQNALGRDSGGGPPVTFAELYARTEIALYVVALDLSRGQPVVFSAHTTPDVSVSAAVMASSAIPGAFPSVRAVFTQGSDAESRS